MEGALFWTIAGIAAVLVGLSKGGLPIVAMMSVPLLSLVIPPLTAAGLLLPIYIISDWFGLWAYRKDFSRRVLAIMVPAVTIGVVLGWATASLLPERAIGGVIGALGAGFAMSRLWGNGANKPPKTAKVVPGLFWGAASGFTSFVSHAGGPPYQIYMVPLRLPKIVFAGTTTILFTYVNAIKLPAYWQLGMISTDELHVGLWLIAPACLGVLAGVRLVKIIPEASFYKFVLWALMLLSLRLMWAALFG